MSAGRLCLAVFLLDITQWSSVLENMFIEGLDAAVCCSGLWRSTVGAHTTPTAFGPIVWLLNWSDRSEGKSTHSHYSALCTVMLGYRVCVYTSQFMLQKHVTHLCVFFSVVHTFVAPTCLCCCVWSFVKDQLYCAVHTEKICGKHASCVLTLTSNPIHDVIFFYITNEKPLQLHIFSSVTNPFLPNGPFVESIR